TAVCRCTRASRHRTGLTVVVRYGFLHRHASCNASGKGILNGRALRWDGLAARPGLRPPPRRPWPGSSSTTLLLRQFDCFLVGSSVHERVHRVTARVDDATDAVVEFAVLLGRWGLGRDGARRTHRVGG